MLSYRNFLLLLILAYSCSTGTVTETPAVAASSPWDQVDEILAKIVPPTFPDRDFLITDYGAVADGTSDALPAIKAAIEACHEAGGGRVVIPAGDWPSNGPIHLQSNVNLHVSEGATVLFSTEPADYLPAVFTRWEGVEVYNYSPLVYALDQENIALTGTGTLDGQASNEHWWPWAGKDTYGWREGDPNQSDAPSRPLLYDWNTREVPVAERILGEGAYLRPNFIQPYRCTNVLIDGVTIRNSPMWLINPVLCENVTIQNIRAISHGPNSDGCDPESCRNVLIKNCYFDTGDDCIALKSGRNQDGRRIGRPIENVVIQDCQMKDGHGGVVIGSEVSGGARNIFAENCVMDSPNLDRALRIKTNKVRGGTIENLYFRNIEIGEVREAVLRVNMLYPIYSDTNQTYIPVVENIYVENVSSRKSKYGIMIDGYDAAHPARNIYLTDCRFDGVADGNDIEHVEGLYLENVLINGTPATK